MAEPLDPNDLATLEVAGHLQQVGDLGAGRAAGAQGRPHQAGSARYDPGAAPARAHSHPATATQQLRDSRPYAAKVARTVQLPTLGVAYPRTEDVGLLREELVMG